MHIVPERDIADLMTRAAAFDAVEKVFAAMAAEDAYNFPVIREALGHEEALYGFKGGFDRAGLDAGPQGRRLLAKQSGKARADQSPVHRFPV